MTIISAFAVIAVISLVIGLVAVIISNEVPTGKFVVLNIVLLLRSIKLYYFFLLTRLSSKKLISKKMRVHYDFTTFILYNLSFYTARKMKKYSQ